MSKVKVSFSHTENEFKVTIDPLEVTVPEGGKVEWETVGEGIRGIKVKFDDEPFEGGNKEYGGKDDKGATSDNVKAGTEGNEYKYDIRIYMPKGEDPGEITIDPRMKVG